MAAPTSLTNFYKNKNIFITGSTGFVGVCLLEKILRTIPEHGVIYLLLRPKRGKEIGDRLEEIKKNQIFDEILKNKSVEQVFISFLTFKFDFILIIFLTLSIIFKIFLLDYCVF